MNDPLIEDVLRAADGDEVAFARVCRDPGVASLLSRAGWLYYAPGLERDDFRQEARLGLLVAVQAWNATRGRDGFLGFAAMVIKRRLIDFIKAALAGKHQLVSRAADLDSPVPGSGIATLADAIPGGADPADVVIQREELAALIRGLAGLSELERRALAVLLSEGTYIGRKDLDNALQRARRKLRRAA